MALGDMSADRITQRLRPVKIGKPLGQVDSPVSAASCDMTVKIVVPTLGNLLSIMEPFSCNLPAPGGTGQAG